MGSGGGGSTTKAAQSEGLRQSNISRAIGQINQVYDNPRQEARIADFLGAARSFYRGNLDREKEVQDRSLKFAMARSGLTGGSAAVDSGRRLGEAYQDGVLRAEQQAVGDANALRDANEQSRMNLISLAQTGADVGTGAGRAASAMAANLGGARARMNAENLGDVFGGLASIYETSRNTAAERRGNRDVYGLLYQPGFGQGGRP